MRGTTKQTVAKARTLRRAMSKPEAAFWQILWTHPGGLKFRRQHPMGPFILDFYCPHAKLAIEVDGCAHDMGDNPERDELRDQWLRERGLRVLRIPATEVLRDMESALRLILSESGGEGPSTMLRMVPLPIALQQGGQ